MTEEEELEVIQRVLDGKVDAFEGLVLHYQDRLLRMIATLLNDERRLAEDLTQTVFVEAFRRLKDFDPVRSRFSTWLFMIARSRTFNTLKKKRPILMGEIPDRANESEPSVGREDFEILDRALHELPDKQKRAFTLTVLDELSYADAARVEATTVGTIKSRVSRAREFLKIKLKHS